MKSEQNIKAHLYVAGLSKNAVLAFGGMSAKFGGISRYELKNTLTRLAPDWNKHFFIDHHGKWYHEGLLGITTNIEDTILYISDQINNYEKVIMIGISAGGYAAILFGSLLYADTVLAFHPQTRISKKRKKYCNLKPIINDQTRYVIYGDISERDDKNFHHISHCYNIMKDNVELHVSSKLNLKRMRDNGELDKIILRYL